MSKALKVTQITLNSILISLTVIILALVGYILIEQYAYGNMMPTLFGYSMAEVTTGSMSPTINEQDLIVTKKEKEYEVDDIITFKDQYGSYTTHRIIELNEDGSYKTQGDREGQAVDTYPVYYEDIVGKVVYIIVGGGKTLEFITSPIGILTIFGSIIIIWLIIDLSLYAVKVYKKSKNKDQEDTNHKNE